MKHTPILLTLLCFAVHLYGQALSETTVGRNGRDTVQRGEQFGFLSVTSQPEGAEVFCDSLWLGRTPIERAPVPAGQHTLRFFYPRTRIWNALAARDSVWIIPSHATKAMVKFDSTALPGMSGAVPLVQNESSFPVQSLSPSHDNRFRLEYVAGGVMVLSGALSAYFKTTSDNKFDAYIINREPMLLDQVHRLDTWAGVSLVVTEISFAVLTYFLLSN